MEKFHEPYPGHFVSASWTGPYQTRVSDKEYGRIRDNVVISCSDVIIRNSESQRILFVRRRIEPMKGELWLIGGRIVPGESWIEAARRHALEDTGLDMAADRFEYIGVYSTVFAARHESPRVNGCHTNNFTYLLDLLPEEMDEIQLSASEYNTNTSLWCSIEEIGSMIFCEALHPLFARIADDINKRGLR